MKTPRPPRRKWTWEFFSYMFTATRESPIAYHFETFIEDMGDSEQIEFIRPHIMAGFHGVMFQEHDGKEWRDVK